MPGIIGNGVSLRGLYQENAAFTWNVSGIANATAANAATGKVVSQDTSVANTVKLAVADESIIGVLGTCEVRGLEGVTVGTVYHGGAFSVPYTGTIAVGDQVCGSATAGVVKKATVALATAQTRKTATVVEIDATAGTCVILFI